MLRGVAMRVLLSGAWAAGTATAASTDARRTALGNGSGRPVGSPSVRRIGKRGHPAMWHRGVVPPHADLAARYRRRLEGLLGIAATEGNRIDVLRNGDEIFPAMLDAIRSARHTVDFLTFIYWDGEIGQQFARCLAARAQEGVRVRVLLDALGARRINRSWIEEMDRSGVDVGWFRPLRTARFWHWEHRTHRKVLICDEEVAFTGGVGIADEWLGDARGPGEWRDTHFRVTGPAVDGLRAAFVDNWAETGRPVWEEGVDRFPEQPQDGSAVVTVVRGEAESGWSDITTLVRALLRLAEQRIRITTAYFAPDPETRDIIADAARRGVRVQLLVPGPHADKRFVQLAGEEHYEALLEAGVEIAAFQPSMLHAKILLVDGVVACIGSANLNSRSLSHDEEVNLAVFDPEVTGVLEEHFDEDWSRSEVIELRRWRRRSPLQRGLERAMGAVAWFI
jgi:cardiolipin synthase A/B